MKLKYAKNITMRLSKQAVHGPYPGLAVCVLHGRDSLSKQQQGAQHHKKTRFQGI